MQPLILGSSSPYRSELLTKLQLPFTTASPSIDESPLIGESPAQLVLRLAENKARKVAESNLSALVIGADQVAVLDGEVLGKPGTIDNAVRQLQAASGKTVTFLTGLALYNAAIQQMQSVVEPFEVSFRHLSAAQIRRYVAMEQPLDCAGSFKSEGLGISLFNELRGSDPNSLIGLPLIRLIDMLAAQGVNVLG
ncbi:MAG: nucleoside triphosphate pyrophosphatase [Methylophaga sp.]|nr:nucleoside triphosphate pyrophosphatase [Methylophaga sp.]